MSREQVSVVVELARLAVETYVNRGCLPEKPSGLPAWLLNEKAGAFVSLKTHGQLRGCIGTTQPTQPSLADEILRNAVQAASADPRFPPVSREELADIKYSVDVLSAPEPVSSPDELDPARFGVIVQSGWRLGLLLPDLEGVDTVDQQLSIAQAKAGISAEEPVRLQRFTVTRYE